MVRAFGQRGRAFGLRVRGRGTALLHVQYFSKKKYKHFSDSTDFEFLIFQTFENWQNLLLLLAKKTRFNLAFEA